ncbi:ATP-dependent nuclease [Vibrio parahaemolyticus]|uniref:ATP-dependent nuclease n=1 Tax=Vibrio parahaemolyticus TaxID=670 RepID=UPI00387AEADA
MSIEIDIKINDVLLWREETFSKSSWGNINYLVGPNGTGKTRFSESLKNALSDNFRVRYLSAERLSGLEKQRYSTFARSDLEQGLNISQIDNYESYASSYGLSSSAFTILRKKIDVRIKVEAFVSELLGRGIKLVEEGGFLKPKLQKNGGSETYDLKGDECHGLKEIISLLTYVYDDTYNCLIIDEPELHLHPHFQNLLLQEIKRYSGNLFENPEKKIFFIVTHSPSFVQLKSLDDLKNLIIFSSDKKPSFVSELNENDEYKLTKLLPRVNIHHKQLFFEKCPIFVEGYFDQQLFSEIQEKRHKAAQGSFIDVGGKEEVDLYYRLTKQLNIEAKCIVDLDALFRGSLRQSASRDSKVGSYLAKQGLGTDLMKCIGELDRIVHVQINHICSSHHQSHELLDFLKSNSERHHKTCAFIVSLFNSDDYLSCFGLDENELTFIRSRLNQILSALAEAGVFVLQNGVLENYCPSYDGSI